MCGEEGDGVIWGILNLKCLGGTHSVRDSMRAGSRASLISPSFPHRPCDLVGEQINKK